MEEYGYKWLLENLISVQMAKKAIPTFSTDDEDPKEITKLKNKLYKSKSDLELLEHEIYKMLKNKD